MKRGKSNKAWQDLLFMSHCRLSLEKTESFLSSQQHFVQVVKEKVKIH